VPPANTNDRMAQKPGENKLLGFKGWLDCFFFLYVYNDINKIKIKVTIQRVGWGRGCDGCLIQFPCK